MELDKRPILMNSFFKVPFHYCPAIWMFHSRHTSQFSVNLVHCAYNGTESALYFWPTIWEQIHCEIWNKKFLVGLKREIKKWKPTECPIVSLIIQISWLLILRIHLLEKTLPVSPIRRPKTQSFWISEHP